MAVSVDGFEQSAERLPAIQWRFTRISRDVVANQPVVNLATSDVLEPLCTPSQVGLSLCSVQ